MERNEAVTGQKSRTQN